MRLQQPLDSAKSSWKEVLVALRWLAADADPLSQDDPARRTGRDPGAWGRAACPGTAQIYTLLLVFL